MDRFQDFTYDHEKWKEFPAYAAELHEKLELKLMLILDPGVDVTSDPFKRALEQAIFNFNCSN